MSDEIRLGDIGRIRHDDVNLWCVIAGATPPAHIVPISASAKQTAEYSDTLTVYSLTAGQRTVPRTEFRTLP